MEVIVADQALAPLEGKTIAVVGNAPEVLSCEYGEMIDDHDFVIRMNQGIPGSEQFKAIGSRTSIVTAGMLHKRDGYNRLAIWDKWAPPYVWWLKHTSMGNEHLKEVCKYPAFHKTSLWHWPIEWFEDLKKRQGSNPSAGTSVLYILTKHCRPSKISVFGITCWGKLEPGATHDWWSEKGVDGSRWHDHDDEANYIKSLGHFRRGPYWFEIGDERPPDDRMDCPDTSDHRRPDRRMDLE